MHWKSFIHGFLMLSSCILIWRCANPVTPGGGPKDVTSPEVVRFDPPNNSIHFKGNTIQIDFKEFINLVNPSTDILISPPLINPPEYRLRGKSVIIKLADSLKANTTYVVSFGKSITDITENNVLTNLSYVLSTGDYIDSLSLKGNVTDAFNLTPQKEIFVFLYIDNSDTIPFDSLPVKVPPYYITRTGDNGEFLFKNLQDVPFKLIALDDQNSTLIFDQPSEKIAFYDTLITPYYIPPPDTFKNDSTKKESIKKDTASDTINRENDSIPFLTVPSFELRLFEEIDSTQRLVKKSKIGEGKILFLFKYPVKNPSFRPFNVNPETTHIITEIFPKKDSIILWISGQKYDSLYIEVSDNQTVLDTAKLDLRKKIGKKSSVKDSLPDRLNIIPRKSNVFNHFKYKFQCDFSYPLSRWDFSRVLLIEDNDTVLPEINFSDSIKRKIIIEHKWKEEKNYKVIFPDSILYGFNDLTNDTIKIEFRTNVQKDFGSLLMNIDLDNSPGDYIIQLLTEKENLVEEKFIHHSGKVRFDYVVPGKFKIKVILDRNHNKKWDTGNYRKNLQPEEVRYFSKTVEIRANWDVEEDWKW